MNNLPNMQYGGLATEDYYARRRHYQTAEIIAKFNFDEYNILDIGGYNGDTLIALKKYTNKRINYSIVDFDKSGMEIAKKEILKLILQIWMMKYSINILIKTSNSM